MGQHITIAGNLGGDPEQKTTSSDKPMLKFTVATTERRQDAQGNWADGATSWYKVLAFDRLAVNAAASLRRGEPVIVMGDLSVDEWTGQDGRVRRDLQVKAVAIGHDLSRGTASFTKASRQAPQPGRTEATGTADSPPPVSPVPAVDRSDGWAAPMSAEPAAEPQPPAPPRSLVLVPDDDEVPF